MSDLISRSKLINDIATNFFSDKFNLERLGRDLREIIDNQPTAYDIGKVVEETIRDKAVKWNNNSSKRVPYEFIDYVEGKREIGVADDVCKWKLEDEEANLYLTGCQQRQLIFEGTPKENGYRYCPYCGKKIKVVE